MRDYRATCDQVVQQFGGHIAQYLGDGVLVYFGFPQAHEDDAHRAAQTGLALIKNLSTLNQNLERDKGLSIEVRVGIHTGLVVVGGIGGNDKRSMALGVTPNIAARLQDLAQPNSVVISGETWRLLNNTFDATPMGQHDLKGVSKSLDVYQLQSERDRFKHSKLHNITNDIPLIGREQEAALLADRLEQAQSGMGQIVLLSGEAGIGKSRLADYISGQVRDEPHYMLQCCGSPYYKNSYLHGVIGLLNRLLDLDNANEIEVLLRRWADSLVGSE